jgi:hypothetical protein
MSNTLPLRKKTVPFGVSAGGNAEAQRQRYEPRAENRLSPHSTPSQLGLDDDTLAEREVRWVTSRADCKAPGQTRNAVSIAAPQTARQARISSNDRTFAGCTARARAVNAQSTFCAAC